MFVPEEKHVANNEGEEMVVEKKPRQFKDYTLSVGFPDSIIQKCQVIHPSYNLVLRFEEFHDLPVGQNSRNQHDR